MWNGLLWKRVKYVSRRASVCMEGVAGSLQLVSIPNKLISNDRWKQPTQLSRSAGSKAAAP